jgi:hypothetical protein
MVGSSMSYEAENSYLLDDHVCTYGIHIAQIAGIDQAAWFQKGDLVAVLVDVGAEAM